MQPCGSASALTAAMARRDDGAETQHSLRRAERTGYSRWSMISKVCLGRLLVSMLCVCAEGRLLVADPQEEEEPPETSSESEQSRASDRRHNVHRAQGRSAEDAIKAQHRGKLTIDVANRGDPHDQSSASIHSASSPRHLTTPKSPLYAAAGGLPASPRPRDNHAIRRD